MHLRDIAIRFAERLRKDSLAVGVPMDKRIHMVASRTRSSVGTARSSVDLTTTQTEIGNVYVVASVPASVKTAIKATGQIPRGVMAKTEAPGDKSVPTPRMGAHPDLTGNWTFTDWIGNYMTTTRSDNQTCDFELYSPSRFGNTGRPVYKPEHWDKVQELDMWTNKYDPVMTCQPLGVPREGPPRRIIQTDKDVVFLCQGGDAGGRIRRISRDPNR
jgi:hypothetical protein